MLNMNRVIKGIIIIANIIIIISGNTKVFATTNNENIKTYEITQVEEREFLKEIYKTETENLKIKDIDKKVSEENYKYEELTETKTLEKQDKEYIVKKFGEVKEFNDNVYRGNLTISDIKIETINNGYYEKIDEKVLEFNNYTDNDLNNIEKEITLNNKIYYLINVKWEPEKTENIDGENVPITYKGNKIYQTVQKISNPKTYKVTVKYSGTVERINQIFDYTVTYENKIQAPIEEVKENNIVPIIIISGIGIAAVVIVLYNMKNTYIYSKVDKGFRLIKRERLDNKNISIDITNCKNKSNTNIYAIKINSTAFKKLKGRTISLVLGNKKKDIVVWNDYYEIKL